MILIYAFIFAGFLLALYLLFLFVCALPVNTSKEYENNSRFYRGLLYSATSAVLKLLRIKVKVAGREKLPAGQKVLFVGNHRSNFDPIIQWQALKSWDLAFISKEENFRIPFLGGSYEDAAFYPLTGRIRENHWPYSTRPPGCLSVRRSPLAYILRGHAV